MLPSRDHRALDVCTGCITPQGKAASLYPAPEPWKQMCGEVAESSMVALC